MLIRKSENSPVFIDYNASNVVLIMRVHIVLEERLRRLEATLPEASGMPTPVEALRPPRSVTPPDAALDARLTRLLKAGAPVPEIARALNCSRAEVELLLALRGAPADTPPAHGQMPLPL
jgi:hypothetical protein